jgi:hypothetical protein
VTCQKAPSTCGTWCMTSMPPWSSTRSFSASRSERTRHRRSPTCSVATCAFCSADRPAPRVEFVVNDIEAEVERLRAEGVAFRNDIVTGPGGKQILLEDPSGNPVELFHPAGE